MTRTQKFVLRYDTTNSRAIGSHAVRANYGNAQAWSPAFRSGGRDNGEKECRHNPRWHDVASWIISPNRAPLTRGNA